MSHAFSIFIISLFKRFQQRLVQREILVSLSLNPDSSTLVVRVDSTQYYNIKLPTCSYSVGCPVSLISKINMADSVRVECRRP